MKVTIHSVNTNSFALLDGPMGHYIMPPAPKGGTSTLDIDDRIENVYAGSNELGMNGGVSYVYNSFKIGGEEIAKDICNRMGQLGVFLPENGRTPTEMEIAMAREHLSEFYVKSYSQADDAWTKTGMRQAISQVARWAADALGRTPAWALIRAEEWKKCPSCAEQIRGEALKCRYCGESLVSKEAAQAAPTFSLKASKA